MAAPKPEVILPIGRILESVYLQNYIKFFVTYIQSFIDISIAKLKDVDGLRPEVVFIPELDMAEAETGCIYISGYGTAR